MSESDRMESAAYTIDAQARLTVAMQATINRLTAERDALREACEEEIKGAPAKEPKDPMSDNSGDTFDYASALAHYHTAKRLRAALSKSMTT